MRFSFPILALLSGLAAALPTVSGDGRGATTYKGKNFTDSSTAIPANYYCTDLYDITGQFDGKVRSIKVEAGYFCKFFTSYGCPPNANPKLEFGRPDVRMVFGDMGPDWDLKIHSAYCAPIQQEVDSNIRALSGGDNGFDNRIRSLRCRVLGPDEPDVE